jgi:hypothetical protein
VWQGGVVYATSPPILPEGYLMRKDKSMVDFLWLLHNIGTDERIEELANPALSTREDVDLRTTECKVIYRDLSALRKEFGPLMDKVAFDPGLEIAAPYSHVGKVLNLVRNHLIFAGAMGNTDQLILMEKVYLSIPLGLDMRENRIVNGYVMRAYNETVRQWEKYGLELPSGLIYVRLFKGSDMQKTFSLTENVSGVTFPCRFVGIRMPILELDYEPGEPKFKINEKQLDETLVHEFVHAFANSVTGIGRDHLPRWFSEGLATYMGGIYESISSVHSSFDKLGNWKYEIEAVGTTDEYRAYRAYFDFIYRHYGREEFGKFLRESLANGEVETPLREVLQIQGEEGLFSLYASWVDKSLTFLIQVLLVAIVLTWCTIVLFGKEMYALGETLLGLLLTGLYLTLSRSEYFFDSIWENVSVGLLLSYLAYLIWLPVSANSLFSRAHSSYLRRHYSRAITHYERFLARVPKIPYFPRKIIVVAEEEHAEAVAAWKKIVADGEKRSLQ